MSAPIAGTFVQWRPGPSTLYRVMEVSPCSTRADYGSSWVSLAEVKIPAGILPRARRTILWPHYHWLVVPFRLLLAV